MLALDGGSFFFGFPGRGDIVALSAALFALPVWALLASIIRIRMMPSRQTVFFLADLVTGAVMFGFFLAASRGIS